VLRLELAKLAQASTGSLGEALGRLSLLVIMMVMPTVESLAWLLPPFAVCSWIASCLLAWTSRISYVGVQAGYTFAIAIVGVHLEGVDVRA